MHSSVFRTDCIRNIEGITEHCFYTDTEFAIKAADKCKLFVAIPVNVYDYRLGREGQSMSDRSILKHVDDIELISKKINLIMKNSNNLIQLKEIANISVADAFRYLLWQKPTKKHFLQVMNYRKYMKNECTKASQYLLPIFKAVYILPYVFYLPVSVILRKRHGFDD